MVQSIAVAGSDGIAVATAVLAVVGVVWLAPLLGVEGAVSTFSDEVLAQEVSVDKFASVVATISAFVAAVVGSGGSTSSYALSSIIGTREELDANVGIHSLGILGSVDGTNELDRSVIAWVGVGWVVLGVAVGACDHNLEVPAILTLVFS